MTTISVAMIVKNEAADLAQCLDTVKDWVDEIFLSLWRMHDFLHVQLDAMAKSNNQSNSAKAPFQSQ